MMKNLHQLKPEKPPEDMWLRIAGASGSIYLDTLNNAFTTLNTTTNIAIEQFSNFRMTYRDAVLADNPVAYWPLGIADVT